MTAKHSEQITHEAPRELRESYTQGLAAFLKQAGKLLRQAFDAGTDPDRLQQVLEFCNQALLVVREGSDRVSKASMLGIIGVTYLRLGKPQRTVEFYSQALQIYRALGDRQGESDMLYYIGSIYNRLGREPPMTSVVEKHNREDRMSQNMKEEAISAEVEQLFQNIRK